MVKSGNSRAVVAPLHHFTQVDTAISLREQQWPLFAEVERSSLCHKLVHRTDQIIVSVGFREENSAIREISDLHEPEIGSDDDAD
ncbi:hypothetical protein [Rhizobium mongolense]|uniref:hypothetical protein n=1 Tax=Rhizobium mongolense TaxID=57676 RepID=UPI0034A5D53A